jgi:hypothetical protein
MEHSLETEYHTEQRMIQFRAKIWKRIHNGPSSRRSTMTPNTTALLRAMTLNTTASLRQIEGPATIRSDHDSQNARFCERFLQLPGEVRNQIYDELLQRRPQGSFGHIPLFRTINVTKQSHSGAAFAGHAWLPINPFTSLRYIGRNSQIWDEIFSRWTSCIRFTITEAFEINNRPSSFKNRILFRQQPSQNLSFARYLDPDVSRVFENSNSWFPVMRSCTLNLHILGISAPGLDEEEISDRILSHIKEISNILEQAKELSDIDIKVCFWPGAYCERASWVGHKFRINPNSLWYGVKPLKELKGIRSITVHAGSSINARWVAKDAIIE